MREVAILNRVVKTGSLVKVTFEQKPEGEEVNHVNNWEKNLPGREKTKCKGPGVESAFREQEGSRCGWSGMSKGERRSEVARLYIGLVVHDVFLL